MAKVVVKSKVKKVKRKFPVEFKAPEIFGGVSLGHSNVTDLKSLEGKSIKMNLMYLTKSMKNQNVRLVFQVNDVDSGVAKTSVLEYIQIPYYMNRFLKVGTRLVEDSFVCESKDGVKLRVKPFVVTKLGTSNLKLAGIRDKIKELVVNEVGSLSAEEFIYNVANGKVQLSFRNEVKKIYPLKAFEFKKVSIEK